MNRMRTIVVALAALAGVAPVAAAQQPTRRPKPATSQAERLVVYKSPT